MIGPNENPNSLGVFSYNGRFPGMWADKETGLFFNWNRYYSPELGRYITSDPLGLGGGDLSTYVYAHSQPAVYADPTGLMPGELPLMEDEIPPARPECKSDDCLCKCLQQYFGTDTLAGTGLATSGLPTEPKPFVTPGSSPATSTASNAASEVFGKKRLPGRIWAPTLRRPGAMTASLARATGRWLPLAGWGMLGYDAYQIVQCKKKCEDDQCQK